MIIDHKPMIAASEHILHSADLVASAVADVKLGQEAASHYDKQPHSPPTWALERSLQVHDDLSIGTHDGHVERTHISAAQARAHVWVLLSIKVGLLIQSTLAIRTSKEDIVLILGLKASDQLQNFHTLLDEESTNYAWQRDGAAYNCLEHRDAKQNWRQQAGLG